MLDLPGMETTQYGELINTPHCLTFGHSPTPSLPCTKVDPSPRCETVIWSIIVDYWSKSSKH